MLKTTLILVDQRDKSAVHRILTDHLYTQKICAKLVPKNLSVEQKANRLEICQDLLGRL